MKYWWGYRTAGALTHCWWKLSTVNLQFLRKGKCCYIPAVLLVGIYWDKWKYVCIKGLYANIHSSVSNCPKLKTVQVFINWWMDKDTVYPCKKEKTVKWNRLPVQEQHGWISKHACGKKPDRKQYILQDSIYEMGRRQKADWWLRG